MFYSLTDWKNKTCKDCFFFVDPPGGVRKVIARAPVNKECRKNPPVIALLPTKTPSGVTMLPSTVYPRMPESFVACSYYVEDNSKVDKDSESS